jgi:serine/threonine-protein kinase/endoribonuclease IRE1
MTKESPNRRPSIACLLFHPFFWSNEKILEFFIDVSNRLEPRDTQSHGARSLFQEDSSEVIGVNWLQQLEPEIRASLLHRNRMNYNETSIEDLIRALRNKKNHYDDMSQSARNIFGPIPDGFTTFWTSKFPNLLMHVYLKFYESGLAYEENFAQFYPQNECRFQ